MAGNNWDDYYARRAREEKWRARSVYKLEEMDKKFRLIHEGDRLLDLGCCPGSWSQYGLQKVGPGGHVAGIDIVPPKDLHNHRFQFIRGDILALDMVRLVREVGPRDGVFSDMAPRTSGIRSTDVCRSMELAGKALDIAVTLLSQGGNFLCKIFEGEDFKTFRDQTGRYFKQIRIFRPAAVRKRSREVYLVGVDFKGKETISRVPAHESHDACGR